MKQSVVIVEDEPLARRRLRDLLEEHSGWINIVGEAADGRQAVAMIDALEPALVFLDIQLPELDGMAVLRTIRHQPAIIFTTAYDRYAVTAFEFSALDYLLKPFGRERLETALLRARERLAGGARDVETGREALATSPGRPLERLFVRHGGKIIPLATAEIDRLEADGDYVAVHSRSRRFLVNLPLAEFESRLDSNRFLRVHRSHIVNLDHVESLEPDGNAQLLVRLRDGTTLVASRAVSKTLRSLTL